MCAFGLVGLSVVLQLVLTSRMKPKAAGEHVPFRKILQDMPRNKRVPDALEWLDVLITRLMTLSGFALDGMTRDTLLKLAAETKQDVRIRPLPPAEMRAADEVFISTTGGGVIAITKVDGSAVGQGQQGPVTKRLDQLYWSKRAAGWYASQVDYAAPLLFAPR